MIGGAPIQMQPGFAQPFMARNPAPAFVPPAAPRAVPPGQAWPQQAPPSVADGRQNQARPTLVRGQMEDEPSPQAHAVVNRSIVIPSPEELGVSNARAVPAAENDRDAIHRLQKLGADFQLRKLEDGYQFVCLLPTSVPGRNRRFEAVAASGDEAVLHVLDEAEKWAGQQ